jgi:hypothetical protein
MPPDLGGWTPEGLRSTFRQFSGVGSDYDIATAIRFVRGVATVVRRREAVDRGANDPKALSVFLLSPDAGGHSNLNREPMLEAGHTTVAGKVWFVPPTVAWGRAMTLEAEDADSVFRIVTEDLRLGRVPTVIVDPRQDRTQVRYYPNGLDELEDYESVRLHSSDADLLQICEVIERVYRQCLFTPDAQVKGNPLWKNPHQFRPYSNAEHKVQAYLKPAFAAAFPTCRVYDEVAGTMGRADLHLEEPDPLDRGRATYLAVLELKVLRSYSEAGKSVSDTEVADWVEKGVKQAGMYGKERPYRVAALCCFDMRKKDSGDQCFQAVLELASELEVALRRWYLYASSELARDAGAITAAASA